MQRQITKIIIEEKKETEIELLTIEKPIKPTRLQKYLRLLKTDNKKNFLGLFKKLEAELLEANLSDSTNIAGGKKDLYIFVTKMLSLMQITPHNHTHYDYLYDAVKKSSLLKTHVSNVHKFWKMDMTESQIQLLIDIREIALNTLKFCLTAESKLQREESNKVMLTTLDDALTMKLFIEPLGNKFVKHSFENDIRKMIREEEKRQGIVLVMMPRG